MPVSKELQITVEEFDQLPEGPPYYQLVGGELIMTPSPNVNHQRILGKLHIILDAYVKVRGEGAVFLAPLDVKLSDTDVFQPDLIFVVAGSEEIVKEKRIEGPPDLVIEILSLSTRDLDHDRKRKAYAQYGVRELWLVDPGTSRSLSMICRMTPHKHQVLSRFVTR